MKLGKLDLSVLAAQRANAAQYCEVANHHATLVNQAIRAVLTDLHADGYTTKQLRAALHEGGMPQIAANKIIRSVFGSHTRNNDRVRDDPVQLDMFPEA